jgi:hypothetical protein
VRTEVERAAAILFADYNSSANRLRVAIEKLLTSRGVEGGYSARLHDRLNGPFRRDHPDAARLLMAIKWIGNSGSHEHGTVTIDDLFDSIDFFSHALDIIYPVADNRRKDALAKAEKVNKNKGPIR